MNTMLILEAKVRDGCKPVLTLDDRASGAMVGEAVGELIEAVYLRMARRGDAAAEAFSHSLEARFRAEETS